MSPLKILILTDSAVLPTGMAETTRLIFTQLLHQFPGCYEIHQIGWYHCYAVTEAKWTIHPTKTTGSGINTRFDPHDRYGEKTSVQVIAKVRPDVVFAFGDPQCILHLCIARDKRAYRLILYLNFDGLPLSPHIGAVLNNADLIVTKSDFSKKVIERCLPAVNRLKLKTLYSPADINRFSILSEIERHALRAQLLPNWIPRDAFLLGWIGRNQWRKQVWLLYKVLHYIRTGHYTVVAL